MTKPPGRRVRVYDGGVEKSDADRFYVIYVDQHAHGMFMLTNLDQSDLVYHRYEAQLPLDLTSVVPAGETNFLGTRIPFSRLPKAIRERVTTELALYDILAEQPDGCLVCVEDQAAV